MNNINTHKLLILIYNPTSGKLNNAFSGKSADNARGRRVTEHNDDRQISYLRSNELNVKVLITSQFYTEQRQLLC
jgi:hypothetical protein